VVIATYQRRELLLASLRALVVQIYDQPFEVIVVVDGSTDGTAAAARALAVPFPLLVIEQPNGGQSRARNRGAASARGSILVFLDDDMEADAHLLAELDGSLTAGADVAFGKLPLHPASPRTLLSIAVGRWADQAAEVLAAQTEPIRGDQFFTGQLAMRREVFDALGGFDTQFAADGGYGNEDLDFGYRVVERGYRTVFNPKALSRQYYATSAADNMVQYRKMGHADVAFARKRPELAEHLFHVARNETREHAKVGRFVARFPRTAKLLLEALRGRVSARVDGGLCDERTEWWFFTVRTLQYWLGVEEAGGIPRPQPVCVLCYHAVTDLADEPILAEYGVPPEVLRSQLEGLRRAGYRFIGAHELVRMLDGNGGVPRNAVLVTFDDAYRDFMTAALPVLQEQRVPVVTFAVTQRMGGTNTWDEANGARTLPLLSSGELRDCQAAGVVIGSHTRTHPELPWLDDRQLAEEIEGSSADLADAGLGRAELFAYPFGEYDARVQKAVAKAGLKAAFTVAPGFVRPGDDRHALRRVEVYRSDGDLKFRLKVATGGRWPSPFFSRAWTAIGTRLAGRTA